MGRRVAFLRVHPSSLGFVALIFPNCISLCLDLAAPSGRCSAVLLPGAPWPPAARDLGRGSPVLGSLPGMADHGPREHARAFSQPPDAPNYVPGEIASCGAGETLSLRSLFSGEWPARGYFREGPKDRGMLVS